MSTGHHNLSCTVSGNFVLLQISLQWETSAPTWIQRGAIILYPRISFHYSNTVFHCCYFCPIKCYCCVTTGNSKDWCKFDLDINEKLYHLDKLQIIYATSFLKAFSTFSSFLRADMTPLICPPPYNTDPHPVSLYYYLTIITSANKKHNSYCKYKLVDYCSIGCS